MSRIGNLPVTLPTGVEVTLAPGQISVKGPLGMLSQRLGAGVEVKRDGDKAVFKPLDDSVQSNALSGTLRALLPTMAQGVTKDFGRKLQLVELGYRAHAQREKRHLTAH